MEKKCFKCNVIKPLTDFYKHPQMCDGYVNKCKECNKNDVKENYIANKTKEGFIEKERKRGRKKYHRLYATNNKVTKNRNSILNRWKEKYPEKIDALNKSINLKKEGFEKHHWSYNQEHYKDVIWLTKKQHMKSHRFIIYDQERKMYRRFDNNILLDTKESHITFIEYCINNLED